MNILPILSFLFLMSSTQGFRFNNFRHLMEEIVSSVKIPLRTRDETRWLEQKLDHFDKSENRIWNMRYFTNINFWKPNGPIYIFLGGESEAFSNILYGGLGFELALETNGALYVTEHRYYGKSIPVYGGKVDLKYLSANQALADNAHLIRTIKLDPNFRKSKVVVIGGSYAGNLATWMRLLYPNLVDAAIASSAPVLAKKNFYEYLEKVSDDFRKYGTQGCWKAINEHFKRYENMFKTKEGIKALKRDENICPQTDMNIPENKQLFFLFKVSPFMNIAQYGNTTAIKNQCHTFKAMIDDSTFKAMSLDQSLFLDEINILDERRGCINYDFYKMTEGNYKNRINDRSCWLYQTCTELGYFMSSSSDRQPFTNNLPVEFYSKQCTIAFGSQFNESRIDRGIDYVNKMYGGLNPKVTNVVFVNGELDPWSRLSILKDLSPNAPAIIIPLASHCEDLFSSRDDDELKKARRNIKFWVKKWIGIQNRLH